MSLKIALGQMHIELGEPQKNLSKAAEMIQQAAEAGANLIVLPELWSTAYDLANAEQHATPTGEGIFAETAALAKTHQIHVVGSCLSTLGPQRFTNTLTWHNPRGEIGATYDKIHRFGIMDEDVYLEAGHKLVTYQAPWGLTGLAICYDLRFPEMFRRYALDKVDMFIVPAEWPHPRLEHWRTLLRARAIENQAFMIACNRVGRSGNTEFCGHSAIIDPWGVTVAEGDESEQLIVAEIEPNLVAEVRDKIPVFNDRRADLYRLEPLKSPLVLGS